MLRALLLLPVIVVCGLQSIALAVDKDVEHLLPPDASVVVTEKIDLSGDAEAEWVVGYALPRKGLPPTVGRAAVIERDAAGRRRVFDLSGTWPGHYPPAFSSTDLTGDGRPELVVQAGGGGAWGTLRVFRRAADAYELLLEDHAQAHVFWDADGDGRLEVIARKRIRSQADQRLQRFIWRDGRFIAWHAPEWSYVDPAASNQVVPDLKGLPLHQADQALQQDGLNLGVIAALDGSGPAGQVIRHERDHGQVHVAIGAGDTRVKMAEIPQVATVHMVSGTEHGIAPIAMTEAQRTRWRNWLRQLLGGARQVVCTSGLDAGRDPTYLVELATPWNVTLGGRTQQIRWVGIGTGVPHRGLLYLATDQSATGYPKFTAAIYTALTIPPAPVPAEQNLETYLKANPELDAFVTVWPGEWTRAARLRGIAPDGWPALEFAPHLEGAATPDPVVSPIPDHLLITVLNGFVRRAVRQGDDVTVELVPAPGRVYRWPLPLTGFNRSTRMVKVYLKSQGRAVADRKVLLEAWRDWGGTPGPGSLISE